MHLQRQSEVPAKSAHVLDLLTIPTGDTLRGSGPFTYTSTVLSDGVIVHITLQLVRQ